MGKYIDMASDCVFTSSIKWPQCGVSYESSFGNSPPLSINRMITMHQAYSETTLQNMLQYGISPKVSLVFITFILKPCILK